MFLFSNNVFETDCHKNSEACSFWEKPDKLKIIKKHVHMVYC